MARGTTLSNLRTLLKAALGDELVANTNADARWNALLSQRQTDLANAYDWPFLKREWNLPLVAGTRYYDLPTSDIRGTAATINFERPVKVDTLYNLKYHCVGYGIDPENYNYRNSDLAEAQDPVTFWQLATNVNETSNPSEVEVWPIPQTAQTLRYTGQRVVYTLTSDAHTADLDDMLIALAVAADVLALRGQANASLVQRQFDMRLVKLRAGYPTSTESIVLGRNLLCEHGARRVGMRVIPVVSGPALTGNEAFLVGNP